MALKLQFNPDLPHQLEAIRNVVELFDQLPPSATTGWQLASSEIVPNAPEEADLAEYWLAENLAAVHRRHNEQHPEALIANEKGEALVFDDGLLLEGTSNDSHRCPHFTVEMETGTGKTYAYFRTMLELSKHYGLRKFVIVVPSVAILEGVKKTFQMIEGHLTALYGVTHFSLLEYDGGQLARIGDFARRTSPVAMVITQQAFNKKTNNFYKPTEKLPGERRPYQWVQETRPVVILDEPQNMGSELSKEALRTLKPLFVLRYSATHRAHEQPNPVYRLTPIQAFRHGLVKQIEVVGVAELGLAGAHLLRLEEVERTKPIQARVRVLVLDRDGTTHEEVVVLKQGDALQKRTKLPEHAGLVVADIRVGTDGEASTVEFSGGSEGGLTISTADEVVGSRLDVWRAQIEKTLETHFERQRTLRPLGIKVLSLFFIDRVANYEGEPGTLKRLFDEAFERMKARFPEWAELSAAEVRAGYFAKTKKKDKATKQDRDIFLDDVPADSTEAKEAFKLIMKDKERLLSFPDGKDAGRNVAFIFAHSALKEGWDNPNVFQICTLNQTTSSTKKRQEIGRGLRLCVDQQGQRPDAVGINILTVIANESYESYVKNLQQNYIDDGEVPTPTPQKRKDSDARRRDDLYKSGAFRDFWKRLCQRLRYTIDIDSPALITACIQRLDRAAFPAPVLTLSKGRFVVVEYALRVEAVDGDRVQVRIEERSNQGVPNPLAFFEPDVHTAMLKVGDDLAKLKKNQHFRGFKVVKIETRYGETRVRFTNDAEISESEVHRFQATRLDDARVTERATVAAIQPIPDVIGRAADETHLTRVTLTAIFTGLSAKAREHLPRNPEGWANVFVREIKEVLADHIVERLKYVDAGGTFGDPENPEALFPKVVPAPQKEHITGNACSLYDKIQVDSEVEKRFVREHLACDPPDPSVVLFFKFPPRFQIDLPRVIGKYNPDWGVVRLRPEGGFTLELVRETKGNDDLSKLRFPSEIRKIRLAQKYFEQLGIDYRAVSPDTEAPLESHGERFRRRPVQLRLAPRALTPPGHRVVPVYDLKAAAGQFSAGQAPEEIRRALLPEHLAYREGVFIAQVVGDSMERVAGDGRWCLWQHLGVKGVGQPATGLHFLFGRTGHHDPDLGEYTFKSYRKGADGRPVLRPMSYNPAHQDIEVDPENPPYPVAQFLGVVPDEALEDESFDPA